MLRQQIDEAIAAYETALRLKPRYPDILNNLGLAFEAKNDKAQAYSYLGYASYRQNKPEIAISYFNKFLEIQTGDIDFYMAFGPDCYKLTNQYDKALKVYEDSISLYPNGKRTFTFHGY